MSPTLPAPAAECLLTEIERLREKLETLDSDLAAVDARIRRARSHLAPD